MLEATYIYRQLHFKNPSGTSRGILTHKDSWFIKIWNSNNPEIIGIGECSIIDGLSLDNLKQLPSKIAHTCKNINHVDFSELKNSPALQFAIETALIDLKNGGKKELFHTKFTKGIREIPINGLLWMGNYDFMLKQLNEKIAQGFSCIKMKVGAIDWQKELNLLEHIRERYSDIEIRVDANGAFHEDNVYKRLEDFAKLNIHSIEQPLPANAHKALAKLCKMPPIPVALDESLIGVNEYDKKELLLDNIKPQYIILKPSLTGGLSASDEWINLAEDRQIGWWATSALESNIGLNAIAQWVSTYKTYMPQGLGTGSLFTNNIEAPLEIKNASLQYNKTKKWACI